MAVDSDHEVGPSEIVGRDFLRGSQIELHPDLGHGFDSRGIDHACRLQCARTGIASRVAPERLSQLGPPRPPGAYEHHTRKTALRDACNHGCIIPGRLPRANSRGWVAVCAGPRHTRTAIRQRDDSTGARLVHWSLRRPAPLLRGKERLVGPRSAELSLARRREADQECRRMAFRLFEYWAPPPTPSISQGYCT